MATGYEDIDKLTSNQNQMLDESLKKQEEIINQKETINKETKKEKRELDDEAFMKSIPLNALNSLTVKEYTETFDRVKSIATAPTLVLAINFTS